MGRQLAGPRARTWQTWAADPEGDFKVGLFHLSSVSASIGAGGSTLTALGLETRFRGSPQFQEGQPSSTHTLAFPSSL